MNDTPERAKLSRSMLFAFIFPTLVLSIMHGPEAQIQAIYAKHAYLPLTALATAILFTRLFDAVTYPLIGYLSDRSYARSGTRAGWVIAGALVSMLGIWFLLRPPQGVTIWYFGGWSAMTYLGWKIIEIPMQAWSYGITPDYGERARVQAWRYFAAIAGGLLFYAMPYLALHTGQSATTELDFHSLGVAAVVCVLALPLATVILVLKVPAGAAAPPSVQERFGLREALNAVRDNRPLLHLLAAFLAFNMLGNLAAGVSYFYIDTYLGLSESYSAIMMVTLLATFLGVPFWTAMSARYERHRVWAVSLVVCAAGYSSIALLTPGTLALPLIFVLFPASAFCLIGSVVVLTMVADIVDYGRLQTGRDQGGLYAAMISFLQKSLLSVATAAGVMLVDYFGFDATAKVQTAGGVFGIKLVCAIFPALGLVGAALIIWNYPLTRARTAEIQKLLDTEARASRAPSL